ncbi:MAG: hypothetical protein HUK24_00130 [Sphaerochaetaceae bacterium]|nr:hypothetical protein [Sphaerochaetaceae bacterium]
MDLSNQISYSVLLSILRQMVKENLITLLQYTQAEELAFDKFKPTIREVQL